jgi:hypothetical protein
LISVVYFVERNTAVYHLLEVYAAFREKPKYAIVSLRRKHQDALYRELSSHYKV